MNGRIESSCIAVIRAIAKLEHSFVPMFDETAESVIAWRPIKPKSCEMQKTQSKIKLTSTRPYSEMSTQKALVVVAEYGPLVVQDVEIYKPGPGELLIEVKAAGLNPADWKVVQKPEEFPVLKSYPAMVGLDAAGIVKEVGEGVYGFIEGDRVQVCVQYYSGEGTDATLFLSRVCQGTFVNRNSVFQQYTVGAAEIVAKVRSLNIGSEKLLLTTLDSFLTISPSSKPQHCLWPSPLLHLACTARSQMVAPD